MKITQPLFSIYKLFPEKIRERIKLSKYLQLFEKKISTLFGKKYGLMVNSGSSANLIATFAAGNLMRKNALKRGDEVLVTGVSWSTTYAPLQQLGLKLKLIDK